VRKLLQKSFLSAVAVQKNRRRKPSAGAIVNEADPHYFYGFSPLFFLASTSLNSTIAPFRPGII
jgi:hypothetical protein